MGKAEATPVCDWEFCEEAVGGGTTTTLLHSHLVIVSASSVVAAADVAVVAVVVVVAVVTVVDVATAGRCVFATTASSTPFTMFESSVFIDLSAVPDCQ